MADAYYCKKCNRTHNAENFYKSNNLEKYPNEGTFPKCKHCGKYIERWYTHNIPSTYSYPLYCKQHAHCNNDSV